ncbi:MAG: histidine triad nucleotide-binding protein [Alphaproteobacteria bacterium]|nr:histidine triad nucleotide-binding protein [Alphaproteobacteria bacterium]
MSYDKNNIFAKILRGEIPCDKIFEDEYTLAFHDINKQAPVHALVIPKGEYTCFTDFAKNASRDEIAALAKSVEKVSDILGVSDSGYRILSNKGVNGGQEVPHLHFHVFGGKNLGRMIPE